MIPEVSLLPAGSQTAKLEGTVSKTVFNSDTNFKFGGFQKLLSGLLVC